MIESLRAGCGTATHAETPSQRKIVRLRVGCATGTRPRAGRCETPPAGCCASGENEKKPAGKCTFLTGFFLHFHCARGLSFRFLKQHAENACSFSFLNRRTGAGPMALLPGVRGPHMPLPRFRGVQGAAQAPAPPLRKHPISKYISFLPPAYRFMCCFVLLLPLFEYKTV